MVFMNQVELLPSVWRHDWLPVLLHRIADVRRLPISCQRQTLSLRTSVKLRRRVHWIANSSPLTPKASRSGCQSLIRVSPPTALHAAFNEVPFKVFVSSEVLTVRHVHCSNRDTNSCLRQSLWIKGDMSWKAGFFLLFRNKSLLYCVDMLTMFTL